MEIPLIFDDPRPILGLSNHAIGADVAWIGNNGVTEIVAYREHGQGDFVPFYAVLQGEHIYQRIPASSVAVTYKDAC